MAEELSPKPSHSPAGTETGGISGHPFPTMGQHPRHSPQMTHQLCLWSMEHIVS